MARRGGMGVGPLLLLLVLGQALGPGVPSLRAEDTPPPGLPVQTVPRAAAPTLDGRLDEPAWGQALRLAADVLEVPPAPPGSEPLRLTPDVRLLEADGRLWIGVALAEDPGMGVGLRVLAGPDALLNGAEAVSIAFAPQELRAQRMSVRGPRGVARAEHYPVRGALDATRAGAWSLELDVPLAPLDLQGPGGVLRLALAVTSRASNLVSAVPVGALFARPAAWLRLAPEGGAWSTGPAPGAAALQALREEDARDEERLVAWRAFLMTAQTPEAASQAPRSPQAWREELLAPLARIAQLRPDLAPWTAWMRGDVLQRLGDVAGARSAYDAALAELPGCREAAFQRDVKLLSLDLSEAGPREATDFPAALARAQAAEVQAPGAYAREGARLAQALLLYKQGELAQATERLEPLARRFPAEPLITLHLERARATLEELGAERRRRTDEDARGDLPRLVLTTARGEVQIDLFEDDAPNSVKHLVWLADRGFYDGTALHGNVPFFGLQGGDPLTREGAEPAAAGTGGPGYVVPVERTQRPALRGAFCLPGVHVNAVGSQFLLATGTAVHLKEQVVVVGRVVVGQEVADRLVEGDRIDAARVTRRRPGTEYRPRTVAGEPAPEPTPTPLLR